MDQTFTTTDGGNETILGWVNTEYGPASGNMRTEDSFRAYLMALHAVNPKMYDLNDAVSEEFTTSMLLVAVILETLGLVRCEHVAWCYCNLYVLVCSSPLCKVD